MYYVLNTYSLHLKNVLLHGTGILDGELKKILSELTNAYEAFEPPNHKTHCKVARNLRYISQTCTYNYTRTEMKKQQNFFNNNVYDHTFQSKIIHFGDDIRLGR